MRVWLVRAWLVIGLALFGYVLTRTPFAAIESAISAMGPLVVVSPMIAALWFATRTSALAAVLGGDVPWRALYVLRWIGDGYNGILPLAGVGGEPFKLRILGRYLAAEAGVTALVRDRLIDNGLGFIVSAGFAALGVAMLGDPPGHRGLLIYAAVAIPVGIALLALMITRAPGRLGVLAAKLAAGPHTEPAPLPRIAFVHALGWFALTRLLGASETTLLLHLVSLPTDLGTILFVDGALNAAGFVGFVMPQGLGVVESAAVFALTGLGATLPVATAFALVRRGRVVVCGVIALILHGVSGAKKLAR
ncbi:hypothetical protein BH11MYX1_BH11MYX1_15050 [soil metagenome]